MDDWKSNTEYHNYSASSPQIQWFWRAVRSYDKEERAKLLQFVTGTSKVPLNGFRELEGMNGFSRFNIHRDYGNKDRLPSSHTCFNRKLLLQCPPAFANFNQSLIFPNTKATRHSVNKSSQPSPPEASTLVSHKPPPYTNKTVFFSLNHEYHAWQALISISTASSKLSFLIFSSDLYLASHGTIGW